MASDDLRARVDAVVQRGLAFEAADPDSVPIEITNGVLAIVLEAQALNDDAWGSVWLHGKWSWLTKCMTTEEREHAADCVARWSARLEADDPDLGAGEPEGLRWWREAADPVLGYDLPDGFRAGPGGEQ